MEVAKYCLIMLPAEHEVDTYGPRCVGHQVDGNGEEK